MGNREDLIEGAKACLRDKGYLRTTARDIASASGVSLAAIGYHFGTKEALLNAALHESLREWGEALFASTDGSRDFADVWRRIIASFQAHRPIWATQFELAAQSDPQIREFLVEGQRQGRAALADLFGPASRETALVRQALLAGVMLQYLVDPEQAPTADDLVAGLRGLITQRS